MEQLICLFCLNCMQVGGEEVSTQVMNETPKVIEYRMEEEFTVPSDSKKKCKGNRPK